MKSLLFSPKKKKNQQSKHLSWFLSLFFSSWTKNLTNSMLKITQEWVYKVLRELGSQGQLNLLSTTISLFYYSWTDGTTLPLFIYFLSLTPEIPLRLNHAKHWEEKRHCILFPWVGYLLSFWLPFCFSFL